MTPLAVVKKEIKKQANVGCDIDMIKRIVARMYPDVVWNNSHQVEAEFWVRYFIHVEGYAK